jgi:hypothetical protein
MVDVVLVVVIFHEQADGHAHRGAQRLLALLSDIVSRSSGPDCFTWMVSRKFVIEHNDRAGHIQWDTVIVTPFFNLEQITRSF